MARKGKRRKDEKQSRGAVEEVAANAPRMKLGRKVYEKELEKLQVELCRLQRWVQTSGERIVVIFEGRDAAGKGGAIKRITERVSPRVFRVVALPAPTERQKTQLYMQRYIEQLPAGGEIVLFDRSWYNRAGVERVMEFCTEEEAQSFLRSIPRFEQTLIQAGIRLIKFFFDVGSEEQTRRFKKRYEDPLRQWKLSPMDVESWARWWDYTRVYSEMFQWSDTPTSPWYVVQADEKRRARLNCIAQLLELIPYERVAFDAPEVPKRRPRAKGAPTDIGVTTIVPDRYADA